MKKKGIRIAAALFVTGGFLLARVVFSSRAEFRQGAAAEGAGKSEEAIRHYDRAAHWYAPGNRYVAKALERLWEIGQQAEATDVRTALAAYDAIRGSVSAIRSFYTPYGEWLTKADPRIAELRAREQVRLRPGTSYEEAKAFHVRSLAMDERPKTAGVLAVLLGFFGWLAATFFWIFRGFDREGRMHLKPSIPWMAAMVVFFSLLVIGLLRA